MLQSASLSAEMQGSLQTKTVYAPPFFAVRMHSVSCCALSLLPSERMQNRVSPSPSSAEYAARVSGFCGQTARIPSSTSALPALSAIPAAAPAPHSSTHPVLVTSRLASAQILSSSAALSAASTERIWPSINLLKNSPSSSPDATGLFLVKLPASAIRSSVKPL